MRKLLNIVVVSLVLWGASASAGDTVSAEQTYVLLIQGAEDQIFFRNNIRLAHDTWRERGIPAAHIMSLGPELGIELDDLDGDGESDILARPSHEMIRDVLTAMGNEIKKAGAGKVIVYVTAHGGRAYEDPYDSAVSLSYHFGMIFAYQIEGAADFLELIKIGGNIADFNELTGKQLNKVLEDSLPAYASSLVVIDSCHAGGFVKHVKRPNGVVITSSDSDSYSFQNIAKGYSNFSYHFFSRLKDVHAIGGARFRVSEAFSHAEQQRADLGVFSFLFSDESNSQYREYP